MEEAKTTYKREQLKKGQWVAFLSTLLILALALLKAFIGYTFNSQLLIADAWHSGADILINLSSLIGLKLASMKKSNRFPYGLYRAETIACLLIGALIVFIGINLLKDGWHKLFLLESGDVFPAFPVGASLVSCAVATFLAIKQRAIGKTIGSQALLATAKEAFFDIFTSLVVLIGILLVYAQIPYIEGGIIILIAALILKLGIETAWNAIMILMDADMDADLKMEIEKKLHRIQGLNGVADVKIRQSGPYKMVDCIIRTTPSVTLYKSHELADIAEDLLLTEHRNIESVFIHVEPEKEMVKIAAIPVQDKKGLNARLHPQFGRAPWFIILTLGQNQINVDTCMANTFLDKKGHVGLNVVKSIVDYKINLLFVSRIGEISFHMLKDHCVDIFKVDREMKVEEIIRLYKKNKLDPITRPNLSQQTF